MPIYHVKTPSGEHIVEAQNQYAAINHVVRETIAAQNLTATDLLKFIEQGMTVEKASTPKQPEKDDPALMTASEVLERQNRYSPDQANAAEAA